jgi:hypothetical protein
VFGEIEGLDDSWVHACLHRKEADEDVASIRTRVRGNVFATALDAEMANHRESIAGMGRNACS